MKYIKSYYGREGLYLKYTPINSIEAYNKLVYLRERELRNGTLKTFCTVEKLSKRRERLIKMYWAFRKEEAKNI